MTSLPTQDECQSNDPNNVLSIAVESARFPVDSSMRIVFTGYYNGFNVEVRSPDEMALLYHMGCFGKGSVSPSKPRAAHSAYSQIMRKRQFLKRNYWYKKFADNHGKSVVDKLLTDMDGLISKIKHDSRKIGNKDVIDLVSSDDSNSASNDAFDSEQGHFDNFEPHSDQELVAIVPDSDTEEGNYIENLKPKCCINNIKLQEKLMLSLQEAFFLSYGLGCLQVIGSGDKMLTIEECWNLFTKMDKKFVPKYVVYHYFRSKGYIVKSGIKFGGDYVLYREGPGVMHSDYIVVVKCKEDQFDFVSVLGHVRMATTTTKEVLIAEVDEPSLYPQNMPEGLREYSVREIHLTRNIPIIVNDEID